MTSAHVSIYGLTVLVNAAQGNIHEEPGMVAVARRDANTAISRRSYNPDLPHHQMQAARAKAMRCAVRDVFPEFFSPE